MLNRGRLAALLAEFLGTALLVMVAIVLSETTAVSYFIGTSVAGTLAVAYWVFNGTSGAHFNPAITFGMWTARRIKTIPAVGYIVAQFLGGWAALQLFQYFTDHKLSSHTTSFTFKVFLAEAIGTLVLSLGFAAAAHRVAEKLEAGVTYGFALFAGIIVASTAAAGYLNPATALGLRSFDWVYLLGPVVGALVGINLYTYLMVPGAKSSAVSVKTTIVSRRKK